MMIQRTPRTPSTASTASTSSTPDLMPVLSRGKHRSPKKGACFMELASFLAGEPWSDHPACTHPLLASLARDVNDHLGDRARLRLAPLIPEVPPPSGPAPPGWRETTSDRPPRLSYAATLAQRPADS